MHIHGTAPTTMDQVARIEEVFLSFVVYSAVDDPTRSYWQSPRQDRAGLLKAHLSDARQRYQKHMENKKAPMMEQEDAFFEDFAEIP